MPNFTSGNGYYNPFYNSVDGETRKELDRRAEYYGAKTRSGVTDEILEWSYRKMAYGHVKAGGSKGITMGFDGPNTMTDRSGNLRIYESTRNVPKYPLLQSIDVTNDGTVGSLLRGKFNFVYWPEMNAASFNMQKIDDLLFVPGREVQLSWGWSVTPGARSRQAFTGIINNFNWSFNIDTSLNAEVSVVSAASLSIGISGDQTKAENDPDSEKKDPAGVAMAGVNFASIIDSDLASITGSRKVGTPGGNVYIPKDQTNNKVFDYVGIGWPYSEEGTNKTNIQTFWYTTVNRLVEATNDLLNDFERSGGAAGLTSLFEVQVDGNMTQHLSKVKSSYPQDVIFPSPDMGSYGTVAPGAWAMNYFGFYPPTKYNTATKKHDISVVPPGMDASKLINIGGILLSVTYIRDTYRNYIQENAANIPYRNVTKFYEDILKRINISTGDMYQITATVCDNPSQLTSANKFNRLERTILSIEDTNISSEHKKRVNAYQFTSSATKPLIKNINISSKPPAPLAAAAFTKARGSRNANVDTPVSVNKSPAEPDKTLDDIKKHLDSFVASGFNDKWCETMRGYLSRLKKVSNGPKTGGSDAHWLHQAIYPVELSITLDGIAGFNFGNIIKTTLLPSQYIAADMVFAVTKIDHKIVPHTWETTLHTVCRLDADTNFGSKI